MFIREVEILGRKYLNIELIKVYQGEDLRTALTSKFDESEKLDIAWSSLTHYIENFELKEFLKKEVLKKWLNIRGRAFVRAWVDIAKTKQFQREKKKAGGKKTESSLLQRESKFKKIINLVYIFCMYRLLNL